MGYIYETHLHTCEASACGAVHGEDYIDYMMAHGYAGMIVTDHFFNGNTCIDQSIPWKERIDLYAAGYERAHKAAEGKDFTVLFAVEFKFDDDEYLIYGIDQDWLKDHEEIMDMNRLEVHALVREAGAIMVNAHPYRERNYVKKVRLMPEISDAIEICNAANKPWMNALAVHYAEELGVPVTAGSDIHFYSDKPMAGMMFDHKIETIGQFVNAVMNREGVPVMIENGGTVIPVSEIEEQNVISQQPTLPVVFETC